MKYILLTRIVVCVLVFVMSSFAFFPGKTNELIEKFSNEPIMTGQPGKNKTTDSFRAVHVVNGEPAAGLLMTHQVY